MSDITAIGMVKSLASNEGCVTSFQDSRRKQTTVKKRTPKLEFMGISVAVSPSFQRDMTDKLSYLLPDLSSGSTWLALGALQSCSLNWFRHD